MHATFLYFESHTKSLKLLHIVVCFSALSIRFAFTISTYFINECTFQEMNGIIGLPQGAVISPILFNIYVCQRFV